MDGVDAEASEVVGHVVLQTLNVAGAGDHSPLSASAPSEVTRLSNMLLRV